MVLASNEQRLYFALARGLWMIKGAPGPPEYEVTYRAFVISELIRLGNEAVREIAFHAVTTLNAIDRQEGVKLIVNSELGNDKKIARRVVPTFRSVNIDEF